MHLDPQDPLAKRISTVMFVVEANSYERMALWREYHRAVDWKDDSSGYGVCVGKVAEADVIVSLNFAELNGQTVMFTDPTSVVVDYRLIEAWLDKHCAPRWDNGHRIARTNSLNFGHCLQAVAAASGIDVQRDQCTTLVSVDEPKEREKATTTFDDLTAANPSIVSPMRGWTLRTAFAAGWIAALRSRLMR